MHATDIQIALDAAAQWAAVNSAAAGLLFVGFVLVSLIWRRGFSVRWTYALGVLILLRLLLPATPSSRWSWRNWTANPAEPSSATKESSLLDPPSETLRPASEPQWEPQDVPAGKIGVEEASAALDELPAPSQAVLPPPTPTAAEWNWKSAASLAWAVVAAGILGLTIFRHIQFGSNVKRNAIAAEFLPPDLLAECHQHAGVASPIPVLCLEGLGTPAVFGFLKPKILLPASLATQLDREQWRHILLHELAHVKGRDVLVNWLVIAARSVHWFNPLAWLSMRRLVADRELVRDSQALGWLGTDAARHSYGHTLLALATLPSSTPPTPSLASLFYTRTELHRRIAMINPPHSARRRWLPMLAGALLLSPICAITFTKAVADDKPGEPPKPEPSATADPAPPQGEAAKSGALPSTPAPAPAAESQDQDDAKFLARLKSIILPRLQIENASLEEFLNYLRVKSVEVDPEKRGVDIILNGTSSKPITLSLRDVSLVDAVRHICELAECAYRLDAGVIVVTADKAKEKISSLQERLAQVETEIQKLQVSGKNEAALNAANEVREILWKQFYRLKYGVSAKDEAPKIDEDEALFAKASALHRDDRTLSEFYSNYIETKLAYESLLAAGHGPKHPNAIALKAKVDGLKHILRDRANSLLSGTKARGVPGPGVMPSTSGNEERRVRTAAFRKKRADLLAQQVELETRLQNTDGQFNAKAHQEMVEQLIETKKALIFLEAEAETEAESTQPAPAATVDPASSQPGGSPQAPEDPKTSKLPFGTPVVGKKGLVYSPYAPDKGYVDVTRIPSGTQVVCPFTSKKFRVP